MVCPCDSDGGWAGDWDGAGSDGDGAGFLGGVVPGVGEPDGGPGVGEAGQIFTGTRPAGLQGSAAAGNARTSGDPASTRATADVYEAFRMEFIHTIVCFNRPPVGDRQGGGVGDLHQVQRHALHVQLIVSCR